MKRHLVGVLLALVILCLAPLTTAVAAPLKGFRPKPQPADCPKNADGTWKYRCLDPDDYAQMTIIKINLEEEVKKLKASSRHFGLGCTLGPGLGLVVDEDLTTHIVPNAVGVNCGLTLKF